MSSLKTPPTGGLQDKMIPSVAVKGQQAAFWNFINFQISKICKKPHVVEGVVDGLSNKDHFRAVVSLLLC